MDVWVSLREYSYANIFSFTLWANEQDALKHTCKEIRRRIDSEWDLDDSDVSEMLEAFDLAVQEKRLTNAIRIWNEFQDNIIEDEERDYWSVGPHEVQSHSGNTTASTSSTFQSSTPGATCRGHHKEYNEYAYADSPDGTYLCQQCKMFMSIFGNKP